jgi:hypothetical protein
MTEELSDYDIVFGAMCFAIPPNEEDEAFAALSRMNETIKQLEEQVEHLLGVISRAAALTNNNPNPAVLQANIILNNEIKEQGAKVSTYGKNRQFDSEADMYEAITGHRPSLEQEHGQ